LVEDPLRVLISRGQSSDLILGEDRCPGRKDVYTDSGSNPLLHFRICRDEDMGHKILWSARLGSIRKIIYYTWKTHHRFLQLVLREHLARVCGSLYNWPNKVECAVEIAFVDVTQDCDLLAVVSVVI
jgi:hypothetical protein